MLGTGFSSKCPRAESYGLSSGTKPGRRTDSNSLAPSDSSNSRAQARGPGKARDRISLAPSSMFLFPLDLFFMYFGLDGRGVFVFRVRISPESSGPLQKAAPTWTEGVGHPRPTQIIAD